MKQNKHEAMGRRFALLGVVALVLGGVLLAIGACRQRPAAPAPNAASDQGVPQGCGEPFTVRLPNGKKLEMVKIKAGTFMMGSPENEFGRWNDEKRHQVTLTRDYWLGEDEMTQRLWQAVMGNNPSDWKIERTESASPDDDLPVENVSWEDARRFCAKLTELCRDQIPEGYHFDLPTEAQWEYACRAGTTTALNNGRNLCAATYYGDCRHLDALGWYNGCNTPHPVGHKKSNAWGLYDMHGNLDEWCRDWYEKDYAKDPEFLRGNVGQKRVCRGGSWLSNAPECRSAWRGSAEPDRRDYGFIGFRVALVSAP